MRNLSLLQRGIVSKATLVPLTVLLTLPAVAGAQPAPDSQAPAPAVRLGGVVFYDYTYPLAPKSTDADGNTISSDAFSVRRTYLNVTGTISPLISFRITPDIARESGSGSSLNGSMSVRLKYGYAQFALDRWLPRSSFVRLGMQQTPFIDGQEGVYRYRFQGTVFAERDAGLSSADVGATFRTLLPGGYGDVHGGIYNGEGYSRAEVNDQKSYQLRATLRPFPTRQSLAGVRLTGFVNADHHVRGGTRRRTFVSALVEQPRFNAGFDYVRGADRRSARVARVDSSGYSVFVTPFFQQKGRGLEGLFRFDRWQADRSQSGVRRRLIAGLAYWFPNTAGSATAALLADYEQVRFSDFAVAPPGERRVTLHGLVSF